MNATIAPAAPAARTLDDRLNPILVKEVRQALRGRFFRWMFGLTLLVTTFLALMVVAFAASGSVDSRIGQQFFVVIYACMGGAVLVLVPFSAFLSTSAEWDENTYDLLVLSNLQPRQIVGGKLVSTLIQALLYYSTFTPFLVAAFLLNGLDLAAAAVVLLCSGASCAALSLIGIALASLARVRALRGIILALFGAALTGGWGISIAIVTELVQNPHELRSIEGRMAVAVYVTTALLIAGVAAVIAMARFSHEEENRSTPMRVLSLALILAGALWSAWMHSMSAESEFAWALQIAAAHPLLLMWIFFVTEPETLGRRTLKFASQRRGLALALLPLLPGGGRGVLLFMLHGLLALATVVLLNLAWGSAQEELLEGLLIVAWFYLYCFVYLALPAGLASLFRKRAGSRILLRVALVLLWPLLLFVPVIFGLVFGQVSWANWDHPFNPYWVIVRMQESDSDLHRLMLPGLVLLVLGVLALSVNLPRLWRGVREVVSAGRGPAARP